MSEFDEKLNALLSNPDSMSQIMKLAQTLSGPENTQAPPSPAPAEPAAAAAAPPPPPPPAPASGGDPLSSLLGGVDPGMIAKALPLLQELGASQNSGARELLYALRPYLKPARQEKIERALQLARVIRIGKKFLGNWGDLHV